MQVWTAPELGRFLGWVAMPRTGPRHGLAATGMRRGEALALRWRDVDLDAGRLAVRRSVGVVKAKGAGERLVEGPTKTGRSRVVDLDARSVPTGRRADCWPWTSCATRHSCSATSTAPAGTPSGSPAASPARSPGHAGRWGRSGCR